MIEWLLIAEATLSSGDRVVQRFRTEQACVAKMEKVESKKYTFTCVNSKDAKDFALPKWRYKNCTQKAPYIEDKTFCGRPR
jgi:hypothetical protein